MSQEMDLKNKKNIKMNENVKMNVDHFIFEL